MSGFSQRVLVRFSCWRIRGWSRWGIHVFGLAFLILATTSCVGWKDLRANYKDGQFGEQNFLNAERAGYKNSNTPRDCLALSGGGIRSAAYSIGALKGLHLIGKLRNLDTISAVSGGSYAATWLYAQYARKAPQASYLDTVLDEAVLDEVLSGAKIKEVAGNAKDLVGTLVALGLLNVDLPSSDFGVTSLVGGAWNLISLIPGLVIYAGGVIWSYHPPLNESHENKVGSDYEEALGRAFHSSSVGEKSPPIQTASRALPYLIVNATIQNIDDSSQLAKRVFEFTPHGMGSPSVGYRDWATLEAKDRAETYSYARIASISGAAVDKRTTNFKGIKFLNIWGRDFGLGYVMLDPTYTKDTKELFFKKQFFVLTDGGDEENLGVYGLIKRNCEKILVVDAEYDGKPETVTTFLKWVMSFFVEKAREGYQDTYKFESYGKLKKKLRIKNVDNEWYTLKIDELDPVTNDWEGYPSIGPPDPWDCWSEPVKTTRPLFKCSKGPVIREGKVRKCKDNACEPSEQKDLEVTYVKLSADRQLLDDPLRKDEAEKVYGKLITKFYYCSNKDAAINRKLITDSYNCSNKDAAEKDYGKLIPNIYKSSDNNFPHYSTAKVGWNENAFLAIAELGCRAVVREYDKDDKAKLNSSGVACIDTERTTGTGDKQ